MLREGESQLLNHFLPHYHFSELHGVVVNAPPDNSFRGCHGLRLDAIASGPMAFSAAKSAAKGNHHK